MIFIGDLHGDVKYYNKLVTKVEDCTFQIGDFGFGWINPKSVEFGDNDFFIRGNHDHPEGARVSKNYLGDYGFLAEQNLFYMGGAWSVDWSMRTPNSDWWYNEELSEYELKAAIDLYIASKPRIMVTHDCPLELVNITVGPDTPGSLFSRAEVAELQYRFELRYGTKPRTQRALQSCFEAWKPEIWLYGHYHRGIVNDYEGTKFVCVADTNKKNCCYSIKNLNWKDKFVDKEIQGDWFYFNSKKVQHD